MKRQLVKASAIFTLGVASLSAHAGLITFEDLTTEGTDVTTQYQASDGVTFSGIGGTLGAPVPVLLGRVGNPWYGWQYPNGSDQYDQYAPGEGAANGLSFITDVEGGDNGGTATLLVFYDNAVADFSFDIIDVDMPNGTEANRERYTVTYYRDTALTDEIGSFTITAEQPTDSRGRPVQTGDGVVTRTGFNGAVNEILGLKIVGTRDSGGNFGLGFDNFNTDTFTIPVPAPLALIAAGLLGLGVYRKRRKL